MEEWLLGLDDLSDHLVVAAVELLEERSPQLGRPLADSIKGSKHKNMKELRPGSAGRSEIRVLYAFDPVRTAILLLAGDKQGKWQEWYRKIVPIADELFDEQLMKLKGKR